MLRNRIISIFSLLIPFSSLFCQTETLLSSRFFHPKDSTDTFSTLSIIKEYNVDRLVWMYCPADSDLTKLKAINIPYSLTLNPQVPDSLQYTTEKFRIKDINGKPLLAPWMLKWKITNPYWGCVNNPNFYKLFLARSKELIDKGINSIFVDDARMNYATLDWGGCFCEFCLNEFKNWSIKHKKALKGTTSIKNSSSIEVNGIKINYSVYKKFQEQSVVNFLSKWKVDLKKYLNHPIKFQTNNFNVTWDKIFSVFDEGICEIRENNLNTRSLDSLFHTIPHGKKQVLSLDSENKNLHYSLALYAFLYKVKYLIPWDVFRASESVGNINRYFGKVDDYGDLFNFLKNWDLKDINIDNNFKATQPSISFSQNNLIFSIVDKSRRKYHLLINEKFDTQNEFHISTNSSTEPAYKILLENQLVKKHVNDEIIIQSSFLLLSEN